MRRLTGCGITFLVLALGAAFANAAKLAPIPLPAPKTEGGMPLMQALKLRSTSRSFAPDPLPIQTLADLLWAAWGINRPQDGKRTAPSARNVQEINVQVITAAGAYIYLRRRGQHAETAGRR